jgi:hypothetical protein
MRRGHVAKTDLTPDEKLSAAYWYLIGGISQHDIAALYHVNPGRINEAVAAIRKAIGDTEKEGEDDDEL